MVRVIYSCVSSPITQCLINNFNNWYLFLKGLSILGWWKMHEQGCGLGFTFCSERAWCSGLIPGHFDSDSLSWHWPCDVDLIWASFMDPKRLLCTMWSHKDSYMPILRYTPFFLFFNIELQRKSFCFLDHFSLCTWNDNTTANCGNSSHCDLSGCISVKLCGPMKVKSTR